MALAATAYFISIRTMLDREFHEFRLESKGTLRRTIRYIRKKIIFFEKSNREKRFFLFSLDLSQILHMSFLVLSQIVRFDFEILIVQ